METIKITGLRLPVYGINIECHDNISTIEHSPDVYEVCPCCNQNDCWFDCDESQMSQSPESEDDALDRIRYNSAIDGIMALILAHYVAGIDVGTPAYLESIETAVEAAG